MKALISALFVGAVFLTTTTATFGDVVFNDNYGTDGGRVSYDVRWVNNPAIGADSIVNDATSFTANKASGGLMQIQIPTSKVGDGTGTPFLTDLSYEIGLQANSSVTEVRMIFINPNVNTVVGGARSRAWAWTFLSDGRLFDNWGGGNLLTNSFDPFVPHTFTLSVADALAGTGTLNIDGGGQNYTIPIGGDSDADPHAFLRSVDGLAGQSITISHTSLNASPPPTATPGLWVHNGFGNWNLGQNWDDAMVPNGIDAEVHFLGAITQPRTVVVDAPVTIGSAEFNNANTYNIAGTASVTLQVSSGNADIQVTSGQHQFQAVVNLASDADVDIAGGASLAFNNSLNLGGNELNKTGAGTLLINNAMNLGNGPLSLTAGVVGGVGKVSGNLENVSGTVAPGTSAGTLSVGGDFTQSTGGTLNIELGGASNGTFDKLVVDGAAALAGVLDVDLINSFTPSSGDTFQILSMASRTGTFSNTSGNMLVTSAGTFAVTYSATGVMLSNFAIISALTGDYNNNGAVDAADYVIWKKKVGTSATLPNDPIGGTIGISQFNQWKSNFGNTGAGAGTELGSSSAPEPTGLCLLLVGIAMMPLQRAAERRRR